MADFSNSAESARLSRRALQTRALTAARQDQLPPRPRPGPGTSAEDSWVEQPASRVRWTFAGRLGWLVALITGGVLILAALWAFSGMPKAQPLPQEPPQHNPISADEQIPSPVEPAAEVLEVPAPVLVHVAGEVTNPGLVELPPGSRVSDAVNAAGGLTAAADLSRINLAAWVLDGERLYVLSLTEEAIPQLAAPGPEGAISDGGTAQPGGSASGTLVNLNTADSAQLQTLSGIGPALAQRIIEHREQFGPFTSLSDLDAVSGIGPAMLSKLESKVTW